MIQDQATLPWLAWWIVAAVAVIVIQGRQRRNSTGLVVAYVVSLWLLHWLGSAAHLSDTFSSIDKAIVYQGLRQSTFAMSSFAIGAMIVGPFLNQVVGHRLTRPLQEPHPSLSKSYIAIGAVSYLVLIFTQVNDAPTLSALAAAGHNFFLVGLCLMCWTAILHRRFARLTLLVAIALALPFLTIVIEGAIGYGTAAAVVALAFIATRFRSQWPMALAGLLIAYVGLSGFMGYFRDRSEIREVVWSNASMIERIASLRGTVVDFEWFDPSNSDHLRRIDARLNQDDLVGSAVNRLSITGDYAHGRTMWESVQALVPRALWPDKPFIAGSGDLVANATGRTFARGTSVGIGHVLELYMNFGTLGVIIGSFFLGISLGAVDMIAASKLNAGDFQGFALLMLVGICFLDVGGSFVALTSSAAASALIAVLVNRLWLARLQRRRSSQPLAPPAQGYA